MCCAVSLTWPGVSLKLTFTPGANEMTVFAQYFCWCDWLTFEGIPRHVPLQVSWLYNLALDPQQVSKDSCRWKGRKGTCKAGFPCLFVSFQDHVSLVPLCVSPSPLFLHFLFFSFLYFLVFDIFLPPLCSLFALPLSAFGEHQSSIGVFIPAGLACAQVASETPGHCAAGPGTSQTAPVRSEPPGGATEGDRWPWPPWSPTATPHLPSCNTSLNGFCFGSDSWERSLIF